MHPSEPVPFGTPTMITDYLRDTNGQVYVSSGVPREVPFTPPPGMGFPEVYQYFWDTNVPEPATFGLLAGGLLLAQGRTGRRD